jgi:hypothetical protein
MFANRSRVLELPPQLDKNKRRTARDKKRTDTRMPADFNLKGSPHGTEMFVVELMRRQRTKVADST